MVLVLVLAPCVVRVTIRVNISILPTSKREREHFFFSICCVCTIKYLFSFILYFIIIILFALPFWLYQTEHEKPQCRVTGYWWLLARFYHMRFQNFSNLNLDSDSDSRKIVCALHLRIHKCVKAFAERFKQNSQIHVFIGFFFIFNFLFVFAFAFLLCMDVPISFFHFFGWYQSPKSLLR